MKIVTHLILAVLVLMSFAAGVAKIFETQQEVAFFASAGISESWLLPLGALQVMASVAAAVPRTRRVGLLIVALGFAISTIVIFMTGNVGFALVSFIPVALAILLAARSKPD